MAKKINEFSILQPLAKELGYKNADELKEALGKEEVGRGTRGAMGNIGGAGGAGTGFLGGREVGSGFGVGIKKRLAGGQGLGQSVAGGFKDFKETLSFGNIKKRALEKTFGGPGFISAFARGKLKKKYGNEKSPTKEGDDKETTTGKKDVGGSSSAYLGILAKSALVLPGMARDTNVLRQNLQKLVKIFAGPQEKGKKAYATKSDASGQILNDSEKERKKDEDFFAAEDKKEADLEASKQKKETPATTAPTAEKKDEDGGGILGTIINLIKNGLMKGLKMLFNPKSLLKALGKVFVIGAIIGSLFSGITAGFKKWQETGSLFEAYKSFLGGILNFLTFGLLGEEEVNSFFNAIGSFLEPLIDGIKGIYYTVKDWIVNNVGIPKLGTFFGKDIGPYYPFKSNTSSTEPEISERPIKAKEDKKLQESEAKVPSSRSLDVPSGDAESKSPSKEPKGLITINGEQLTLPSGASFNSETGSLTYKGVSVSASEIRSQDELNKVIEGIDNKSVVEFQGKDASGAPVTKTVNGATGEISVMPPKQSPTPADASSAASPAGGGGGGGEVSASSGGGETASPPSELAATPPESGSELSDASAQIAEAQRMESAADIGSSIDASSTNNSSGSTGKQQSKIADVYDTEFANLYAMA